MCADSAPCWRFELWRALFKFLLLYILLLAEVEAQRCEAITRIKQVKDNPWLGMANSAPRLPTIPAPLPPFYSIYFYPFVP